MPHIAQLFCCHFKCAPFKRSFTDKIGIYHYIHYYSALIRYACGLRFCGLFVWPVQCVPETRVHLSKFNRFDWTHFNGQTLIELCRFQFVRLCWFCWPKFELQPNRFFKWIQRILIWFSPNWTFLIPNERRGEKKPSKDVIVCGVELPHSWNKTWLNWIIFEKKFSIWAFDPFPFQNQAMHRRTARRWWWKTKADWIQRHTFIWKVKRMPLKLIPCNFYIHFVCEKRSVIVMHMLRCEWCYWNDVWRICNDVLIFTQPSTSGTMLNSAQAQRT